MQLLKNRQMEKRESREDIHPKKQKFSKVKREGKSMEDEKRSVSSSAKKKYDQIGKAMLNEKIFAKRNTHACISTQPNIVRKSR